MDFTSFKTLLKDYNAGKIELPEAVISANEIAAPAEAVSYRDDDPELTRDRRLLDLTLRSIKICLAMFEPGCEISSDLRHRCAEFYCDRSIMLFVDHHIVLLL